MKNYIVYADGVLVDSFEQRDNYTEADYRSDCTINGWEFAPCSEESEIEVIEVEE